MAAAPSLPNSTERASGRGAPTRFVNVAEARARFGARAVDRLAPLFWVGDPMADEAIESIRAMRPGEGFALLKEAARVGASRVPGLPPALARLVEWSEEVPSWVDWDTIARAGRMFFRAGPLAGVVLGAGSIVFGYLSPGGNKPLVFSGRLQEQAAARLDETARFVQAIARPGGARPRAEGWQIALRVRLIHAQVRRMLLESGRYDVASWGVPINQHDMAGTTLLFSIVVVEGLRRLGVPVSREDAEAYIHLWRWMGRLSGVDPELLPKSMDEARSLGELVRLTQGAPDHDSRALTRALLDSPFQHGDVTRRRDRAFAARQAAIGTFFCRALHGDAIADALDVPRSPFMPLLPALRGAVFAYHKAVSRSAFAERRAIEIGERYWDDVIKVGLAQTTYDFGLPERLGGLR